MAFNRRCLLSLAKAFACFGALFFSPSLVSGASAAPTPPASVALGTWDGSPESEDRSRYRPVVGMRGMVAADDRVAAEWGAEILRRGGNAVDAAVATAFAMAVTRPHYASLGGGGFLLYCPPVGAVTQAPECVSIDYREKAPAGATRDLYVRNGKVDEQLSKDGALASGVPGVPAGLLLAHSRYGVRSLKEILSRPIELAEKGMFFTARMEAVAQLRWNAFNPEAKRLFGCGGKGLGKAEHPCEPGTRILQPELARVLKTIAKKGHDGFYRGWVAERLIAGLKAAGGIMTVEDLAAYQAEVRKPLATSFKGAEVVTMAPPSGGGTGLLQMLGYVERAEQSGEFSQGYGSARSIHALAFAMSLAFADRARFMGDPGFFQVPVAGLLAPDYLNSRWKLFHPLPSGKWKLPESAGSPAGDPFAVQPTASVKEGQDTTHFSVVDRQGGAVALTTTVNDNYGSGFVPEGTGVVMNNEMDDFSAQPGVPNLYGLVGSEANSILAGKRPLSSMTPTIVRTKEGQVRLVLGAQGGPRITTSVFQAIVNRLQFGLSVVDAINVPRFHHQWRPQDLLVESNGFGADTLDSLKKSGYSLKEITASGRMHGIERFANGRTWGAPDRRAEGAAVAE